MANHSTNDRQFAINGINHFFDVYRLPTAIAYTESILEAATLPKVWRREIPANGLCFMENMQQLITAAYALHNGYPTNNDSITGAGEAFSPDNPMGNLANNLHSNHTWETFPHNLTTKQYANPLNAISQCCDYMQEAKWKQLFNDITECALSNTTLYEMQPQCNILRVRRYLLGLLEACFLIGLPH